MHSAVTTAPRSVPTLIAAGAVVGALTSPFVAVYTVLLGIPAAALAWIIGRRLVAAAALGLVLGASLYFLLAVVVSVAG
jgi:hypothetical protein